MDLVIDVQAADALRILHNGERRIGYALVNALNNTAKDIQREQRANVSRLFTVRKKEFIMREAAYISFANLTKGVFQASVSVGNQKSPKARLLLPQFETGGQRKGFVGKTVAVPLVGGARPSKESEIPQAFRFAGMGLQAFRGGKKLTRKMRGNHKRGYGVFGEYGRLALPDAGNKVTWRGKSRTYLVPHVGVFQRTGPGQTRMLWAFHPSVKLLPVLHFIVNATAIARTAFPRYLKREVDEAFAHALAPLLRSR